MVTTAPAPKSTPHPVKGRGDRLNDSHDKFEQVMFQRNLFMSMALNMTWQLALVVVVPIVGGYMLDQRLHTAPWLTVIGLVVASIGVIGVLKRIVTEADTRSGYGRTDKS